MLAPTKPHKDAPWVPPLERTGGDAAGMLRQGVHWVPGYEAAEYQRRGLATMALSRVIVVVRHDIFEVVDGEKARFREDTCNATAT